MSGAPIALTHVRLITPEEQVDDATVVIVDGRIVQAGREAPPKGVEERDLTGSIVAPGLIDLHVHGGGGFSLIEGEARQTAGFAGWAVAHGITAFLPTLVPDDPKRMLKVIQSTVAAAEGLDGAKSLGMNLEGPFLNPSRCGALNPDLLRTPDLAEFRGFIDAAGGRLRIMTLAPELSNAERVIAEAGNAGIAVALGHSNATYEEAASAFALGLRHVTHCFNAMRPFDHRDPGCAGAALTSPDVTCELIADGVHVHPAATAMLLRLKGVEKTVLVSDGIPATGLADGAFELQGQRIEVRNGVALRADGTLAGSAMPLDAMVRNLVHLKLATVPEAIRMATLNPASVVGIDDRKGRLAPGYDADLVVLSPELEVEMTFVGGRLVYES
jgi:N-acetylglucosamine-6-phosphate deacetylase